MEFFKEHFDEVLNSLKEAGFDLLIILIIFLIAKLCLNIVSKITKKTMDKAEKMEDKDKAQQLKTSMTVTHSLNRYVVYAIAIILILRVVGLGDKVSSALVAAGISGLIISLGAQSIVKDMFAGLFILFEKQYYVGDHVKIGTYEGTVISIALRVTYLDCDGNRVIIPNGDIRAVVNYSRPTTIK